MIQTNIIHILEIKSRCIILGRKRTSKKKNYVISIDYDLMEKLKELEVNRSLLFTDAAKKYLKQEHGLEEPYIIEDNGEKE